MKNIRVSIARKWDKNHVAFFFLFQSELVNVVLILLFVASKYDIVMGN